MKKRGSDTLSGAFQAGDAGSNPAGDTGNSVGSACQALSGSGPPKQNPHHPITTDTARPKRKRARPATDRQREVLAAIRGLTVYRGFPPTVRDLGKKLRIRSTNGVNCHLRFLEAKGLIRRDRLVARSLRVTRRGLKLLGVAP